MARIVFAKAFRRLVDCPDGTVHVTGTLGDAFAAYFADHPRVRSYVLDDAGAVRKHVAVFVDDELISDRRGLTDPVGGDTDIHVFQALSGG